MNWSVDFDKDIMEDRPLKRALKASPWVKKVKRAPYPNKFAAIGKRRVRSQRTTRIATGVGPKTMAASNL